VSSFSDAKNLKSDLDQLVVWYIENDLFINISKCIHIYFYRHNSPIIFKFCINNEEIIQMDKVRELSIIFSNDLSAHRFSLH
jgi:hypothetical protein